jgi:geranylgeranyl pyrophosphate synthase
MYAVNALAHLEGSQTAITSVRPTLNLVQIDPIQQAYRHSLPSEPDAGSPLSRAIQYVLSHPGSLHRARLANRIAADYGADHASAVALSTALEYFHTASLIFDDLPCMDDAGIRRGAICIHLQFGQHEAILVALALINRAYALAWQAVRTLSAITSANGLEYLEARLGVSGLLAGQSADLNYASLPHNAEVAVMVAMGKTVSLIRLSLVWPALLFGAAAREITLLERLALCWGLAYQAADDLKDLLQDASLTGKTPARDTLLDRPNLAVSLGVPATVERLQRLIRLGDVNLRQLLQRRPTLRFLEDFRLSLNEEVAVLTLLSPVTAHGGRA